MGSVEVDDKVKKNLEEYKLKKGIKSLSDAIAYLLLENKLLTERSGLHE